VELCSEYFTTPALEGVRLHTLVWGDPGSPALVLLHGGGANAHWWSHLGPSLADRFRVVALDFRGHGCSDHPRELAKGAFRLDLEALLEHLGREGALLVGHSMGGGVALRHAAGNPLVRGLVLVDVPHGSTRRIGRTARLALSLRRSYRTREEAVARYRFLPAALHASEELRTYIAEHSVREEADGRFGYAFDPRWFSIPPDSRAVLEEVRCPTLVMRGSESDLLSHKGARAVADRLPDARWVEIAAAGHHIQLDRPDAFISELQIFMAEVADRAEPRDEARRTLVPAEEKPG